MSVFSYNIFIVEIVTKQNAKNLLSFVCSVIWEEFKRVVGGEEGEKKKKKNYFFLHFNSETITHANWQFCLFIRSLSLSPPSILQRLISPTKMAQSAKANSIRGF